MARSTVGRQPFLANQPRALRIRQNLFDPIQSLHSCLNGAVHWRGIVATTSEGIAFRRPPGRSFAMAHPPARIQSASSPPAVGRLLQYWRRTRSLSQLALANEANVSPRHVSFVETGRTKPSRGMVLHLAEALGVPLRERNALLLAAGFAPVFRESSLDAAELTPVRAALEAILRQQEPYPAVVMNRQWDIISSNDSASRFFNALLDGRTPRDTTKPANVLRLMFHPDGLRPAVTNWSDVAQGLLQRVQREAVGGVTDAPTRELLSEILEYPGVPKAWRSPDLDRALVPVVPVSFRLRDREFNYFSAVTVLGTPQDVTLQELRIESFFPSDAATAAAAREFAALTPPATPVP
jgi:transcriptional regulator with XRE-family HTH domain